MTWLETFFERELLLGRLKLLHALLLLLLLNSLFQASLNVELSKLNEFLICKNKFKRQTKVYFRTFLLYFSDGQRCVLNARACAREMPVSVVRMMQ